VNEPEHTPDVHNKVTGNVDGFVVQAGTINGGVNYYGYRPPAPEQSGQSEQSGDAFGALVDALLAVPSVSDEPGRRLVLRMMRREIAQAVPHHQGARLHVIALVRTCLDYDDGLDDLLRVLRELEGESIPVRRSAEAARALVDQKPGD
jgi:hypothetical protein